MGRQYTTSKNLIVIAGVALGLGLVALGARLEGTALPWNGLPGVAVKGALELLPYFLPTDWQTSATYAFDHQSSACPLQLLGSFWPLLRAVAALA